MKIDTARAYDSAIRYELVSYTDGVYESTTTFKGLLIATEGDITITGTDDVAVTFPVSPGLYPFAGKSIVEDGTTAEISVVLF